MPDVTGQTEAEEFRSAVMDNMMEGLFTLDGDGLLTFMNRAASKMLGWSEEELRGKDMHAAVHFQRADGTPVSASDCPLLKVRHDGKPLRVDDDAFTRKDGSILPVAFSAMPLLVGAAAQGTVVVFRDITDEKSEAARTQRELDALSWVGRIRDALDQDRFVLYSQPIVSLDGAMHSEELLVRMVGRTGEVILPGSFLPVAEKYGLIGEIDRWVIIQAIRLAANGRRVEANLSASSIGDPNLVTLIERELDSTGADPANIVFEITETALIGDIESGQAFARFLTAVGCGLALDDFGTGFGSFTYLKRLPLRYLKIDIEFVRDLIANPANLHLIRAIVSLAHAFNLKTIAEGIEDEQTLAILRREGVDFGQGFYFGWPSAVEGDGQPTRLEFPGLTIDTGARDVIVDGRRVELTGREFDLLSHLAAAPGQAFSREQLVLYVWHLVPDRQTCTMVSDHVRRLRRKIESDSRRPRWIWTVVGAGYKFDSNHIPEPGAPKAT